MGKKSHGGGCLADNKLEAYADAQEYDRLENDAGVAFYTALAQETGGSVLEIACGTGRVSIPIARLGFAVTGLDLAPGMLEEARRKSAGLPVRWVEADGRAFDLGERFRLIFLTGNAFQQFLTNADQEALLQCVQAHLDEEGWFAFETRNPLWAGPATRAAHEAVLEEARLRGDFFALLETRDEEQRWQTCTDVYGLETRESFTQAYDHVAQILHLTSYRRWHEGTEERTTVTHEALRYTFPQELAALLQRNGFTVIRQFGDWNLEPLSATSTSIIVVCRRQARLNSS
jgi:SAM-dependent methyltransferase